MSTITVWLLISIGNTWAAGYNRPTVLVARFADVTECERVRRVLRGTDGSRGGQAADLQCVQATIVKEHP